jgi:predicted RNA-binding Zn ribbon-like protein
VYAVIASIPAVDPPSLARFTESDRSGITALAGQLRAVFGALDRDDVDAAAAHLNALLTASPAHPHLAKEDGVWHLHHHAVDAGLVPMCTAICAEGVARLVGTGRAQRLGTCAATDCERVFIDVSKNASRRFCSTLCQNRTKAAAFRERAARSVSASEST